MDPIYTQKGLLNSMEAEEIDDEEMGFMTGYLAA